MPAVTADVAEVEWAKRALFSNAGSENLTLKLYSNNITPAEGDTASTYTEATFTNYVAKTLTSSQSASTWAVPTTTSGVTSSTYQTNQTWTCGATGQTIYGLYAIFAISTILALAESFSGPITLADGSTLTITPKIVLD